MVNECLFCGSADLFIVLNSLVFPSPICSTCAQTWHEIRKQTRRENRAALRAFHKNIAKELRREGCALCLKTENIEFHHVISPHNQVKKKSGRSSIASAALTNKGFLEEISKCVLLCHDCHRETHREGIDLSYLPRYTSEELRERFEITFKEYV